MRELKKAIRTILAEERSKPAHKINLLGLPYQQGTLEGALSTTFSTEDRVRADRAFEELKRDVYNRPTYRGSD